MESLQAPGAPTQARGEAATASRPSAPPQQRWLPRCSSRAQPQGNAHAGLHRAANWTNSCSCATGPRGLIVARLVVDPGRELVFGGRGCARCRLVFRTAVSRDDEPQRISSDRRFVDDSVDAPALQARLCTADPADRRDARKEALELAVSRSPPAHSARPRHAGGDGRLRGGPSAQGMLRRRKRPHRPSGLVGSEDKVTAFDQRRRLRHQALRPGGTAGSPPPACV